MTPDEYCQHKAAVSGSSLYYSVLFLPPDQRRAVTALYALCRELADAVREAADPGVARAKLAYWRAELHSAFAGSPQHPVTRALGPVVRAYAMAESDLMQIIDGIQMDLEYNRYPDFATLEVYCHRVAGVVGLLSARIFGYTDAATLDYARTLGLALRLTDIIRDVGEDARHNRIYLPLDELARFGLTSEDIIERREDERFERAMAFQIARAHSCHDRALGLLPHADRRAQRAGLVLAAISRTLLEEIARLRGFTLRQRVALTPVRKLWIAWRTWVTA
ncbi:MAG TPA: presqualene diphosphate synthase HpnD [Burkholderiales bacterium]|nr:presqualene diphosphate synthase HpnD [Burkholderiales bacterium]